MIDFRLATSEDNAQLLELTSSTGMAGKMALRIDRHPNFFALNKLRGKTKVYIAIENDVIVGSICVSDQKVYIDGQVHPLYYISDFKVAATHRNKGIGLRLTNEVVKYLETQNADFAFLNVAKGNKRPFVFFSERSHYSDFENIGVFKPRPTDSITPKKTYVLIPFASLVQFRLVDDAMTSSKEYQENGKAYLQAPYDKPPYKRIESVLMRAFSEMPKMEASKLDGPRKDRIYELRSYEAPTHRIRESRLGMPRRALGLCTVPDRATPRLRRSAHRQLRQKDRFQERYPHYDK